MNTDTKQRRIRLQSRGLCCRCGNPAAMGPDGQLRARCQHCLETCRKASLKWKRKHTLEKP
jgi:hypothetical protein